MAQARDHGSGCASEPARKIEAELDSLESLVRGASEDRDKLTTVIRTSVDAPRGLPDDAPDDGDTFMDRGIAEFCNRREGTESVEFLEKSFGLADLRTWATNPVSADPHVPGASSR